MKVIPAPWYYMLLLKWFRADAMAAVDGNIYYRGDCPNAELLAHERKHLLQMQALGKTHYFIKWAGEYLKADGDESKMKLEQEAWKKDE